MFQGPELEEQKLLILRREIEIHCSKYALQSSPQLTSPYLPSGEITHESDQRKLQRCLREQLKSSAEAAVILQQVRDLQGIPKTDKELKSEKGKVCFFKRLN